MKRLRDDGDGSSSSNSSGADISWSQWRWQKMRAAYMALLWCNGADTIGALHQWLPRDVLSLIAEQVAALHFQRHVHPENRFWFQVTSPMPTVPSHRHNFIGGLGPLAAWIMSFHPEVEPSDGWQPDMTCFIDEVATDGQSRPIVPRIGFRIASESDLVGVMEDYESKQRSKPRTQHMITVLYTISKTILKPGKVTKLFKFRQA